MLACEHPIHPLLPRDMRHERTDQVTALPRCRISQGPSLTSLLTEQWISIKTRHTHMHACTQANMRAHVRRERVKLLWRSSSSTGRLGKASNLEGKWWKRSELRVVTAMWLPGGGLFSRSTDGDRFYTSSSALSCRMKKLLQCGNSLQLQWICNVFSLVLATF